MGALESDDPRRVGAYRLLRRLGSGGMGRVYLGRTAGGRTVAVKVVRPELADDPEFRARFRQEVAAARRVGGAWTAPVLDADTEGGRPWVATGYVAGPALATAVRTYGPLPEPSVRSLGVGLAEALAHVHGLGLVHRDVKPSNVLLTLDGPRLIDFGIARALDAAAGLTRSGYVVGSPGFMSPEQANGQPVGPAGDVFSLGAVLAYAATGVHPFGEGVSAAVLLYRVLHEEPDVAGLPDPLRTIVLDCLAKDPAARPTPQRLRARLDGDGAAATRLAQGGWLPAALAAGVGRAAVELLDLDGEPEGAGSGEGEAAGPVPSPTFVSNSVPGPVPDSAPGSVPDSASDFVSKGYLPPGPVRSSDSVPAWRRRAGALAVAAVVAAGLGGGGYGLYAWLHRDRLPAPVATVGPLPGVSVHPGQAAPPSGALASGTATAPASASGAASAPATGAAPATGSASASAPGTGGPNVVPAAFLGTWSGEMVTDKGLPGGTTTLTVRPAAIGEEATTSRNALSGLISISCEGAWTLKSASATRLVFQSRLVRSSMPGACTGGADAETLTLQADGTIRFTSADPAAGNPAGTMRKATGAAG
ncbi:serine/threonine-protein kinase [Kitasatospora sp. SUK 42]|uniref:serine/threonine-protein kinase n=1 Tax=Kitasatospora sp. SUK 42 TaxID=1588882 RepID=UPI0018CA5588|nr:serine/threonine-protein kinase [Kitasatospora sp. SUK 42]MBV2152419.1 serine/threonine protein kinase [Kitasatospora sp. SUK 42]